MREPEKINEELEKLILLIKKLRAPDGCPWDKKQKKEDIGKYILEEAYEVVESLEAENRENLREELGDLLFQILFLAEMAEECGEFSLSSIMTAIHEKMIRRHPHVFGERKVTSVEEVKENWQQIKNKERSKNGGNLFSGIPRSLPALKRAQKITAAAAVYGFDWSQTNDVLKKVEEEICEFKAALNGGNSNKMEEEMGDMIFSLVNLCRFVHVDAETALTQTTNKFLQRFSYINRELTARGKKIDEASLEEMDALWEEAKKDGL